MKIAITGHLGFVGAETKRYIESIGDKNIGSSVTTALRDHEVVGFDLMEGNDIRDAENLDAFVSFHKPDRILHLAAIARFADADKDPKLAFETNVMGTRNIALIAKKHKIPTVYASTGSVYMPITDFTGSIKEDWPAKGNSVYGCTKFAGETYISSLTPHIILRYAHLYGQEKRMHGLIGGFVDRIQRGLAPTLYGGKQSNDFTYIKDVARANYLALTAPWDKWNQVYNIGTGEELSAEKAGQIICKATGWKGKIERRVARTVDPERFNFDVSKASRMLNFDAQYDFQAGLLDMFSTHAISISEPVGQK